MADVADQLNGIVDDLLGIVNALQLRGLVEIDQVFIEVEPCRGEQGTGIVVKVGGYALPFLFLETDGRIQQCFLLFILKPLQLHLVADDLALVEDDEYNHSNSQDQHTDGAEKQQQRYFATGIIDLEENHGLFRNEYIKFYRGFQEYHVQMGFPGTVEAYCFSLLKTLLRTVYF